MKDWKLKKAGQEYPDEYSLSNNIVTVHFKIDENRKISSIQVKPNYVELGKLSKVSDDLKSMKLGSRLLLTANTFNIECQRINTKQFSLIFHLENAFFFIMIISVDQSNIIFEQKVPEFSIDQVSHFINSLTNYGLLNSFSNFQIGTNNGR